MLATEYFLRLCNVWNSGNFPEYINARALRGGGVWFDSNHAQRRNKWEEIRFRDLFLSVSSMLLSLLCSDKG